MFHFQSSAPFSILHSPFSILHSPFSILYCYSLVRTMCHFKTRVCNCCGRALEHSSNLTEAHGGKPPTIFRIQKCKKLSNRHCTEMSMKVEYAKCCCCTRLCKGSIVCSYAQAHCPPPFFYFDCDSPAPKIPIPK